eukprot:m.174812 g.174812  ORF g.174812 m.174812 type:complete len:416 (+) comp39118_c0_seq19:3105-4352(+)
MATDQFSRGKGRLSEGLTSLQQLASICTKFKEQLEAQLIQKRSVEEKKRQKIAARFSELTSELENLQRLFLSELRKEAASRTQLLEGRLLETEGTRKGVIHVTSEVTSLLDVKEKQLFFSRFCPTSALLQSCIDKLILLEANEMGAEVEEVESPWLCESKCENVYEAVFKLLANSEGSVAVEQTGPDLGTDEAVALKVESLSISEDDKRSTMSPALSISSGSSTSCSFPSFPISNSCYFHAVVTDVESPSNFWLQCVSDQHNEMMAQLEYEQHSNFHEQAKVAVFLSLGPLTLNTRAIVFVLQKATHVQQNTAKIKAGIVLLSRTSLQSHSSAIPAKRIPPSRAQLSLTHSLLTLASQRLCPSLMSITLDGNSTNCRVRRCTVVFPGVGGTQPATSSATSSSVKSKSFVKLWQRQ